MKNLGCKVEVTFKDGEKETFRNITEIHFGYKSVLGTRRIAIESDIHGSGATYDMDKIKEFEIELENREAKIF